MWPMARTISRLLDRMYALNEFVGDQWEAKNKVDVSGASKGISIRILLLLTERRRF